MRGNGHVRPSSVMFTSNRARVCLWSHDAGIMRRSPRNHRIPRLRLLMRLGGIMRSLLGTAFLLISTACFAADITPPVDMGGAPPMYGEPMYRQPVYVGPVYGGPVYGGPVYRRPVYGGPVYGGPVYGGPVYGGPAYGGPV